MKKISLMLGLILLGVSFCSADAYDYLAGKISKGAKQLTNKKIAVLPFQYYDGRESPGSTIVSEHLTTAIVQERALQVVERTLIDKIMGEMKLGKSGIIDQQTTKELGKVLGVDAIVTGTLIEDINSSKIEINARLIKVETGDILVAASKKIDKTWIDSAPVISKVVTSPQTVPQNIQPQAQTAPQMTSEESVPELESGERSLGEQKYDEALLKAGYVLKKYPNKPALASRAWYVIGRVHEAKGEIRKAEFAYLKIIKNYPKNVFVVQAAKERLQALSGERKRR